jgi:hypothetical protein
VAVYLGDHDGHVAALNHRLKLVGVAPSDATAMELDRVTQCARTPLDLRLVTFQPPHDRDAKACLGPEIEAMSMIDHSSTIANKYYSSISRLRRTRE